MIKVLGKNIVFNHNVLHRVQKNETTESLAKQYNIPVTIFEKNMAKIYMLGNVCA